MSTLTLTNACPICAITTPLFKCQGCFAISYCSREHQLAHRTAHKRACTTIKKALVNLSTTKARLLATPGDAFTPAGSTLFTSYAGRFWGIHETRPYMQSRFAVVEALLKVKSTLAVESALEHILDMLRLCRGDNMGVRDLVAPLFLRLGRDQECYDFVKWWRTTAQEPKYDWGNMNLPYLHLRGEDPFEPPEDAKLLLDWVPLNSAASVMLLKLRLLRDLKALDAFNGSIGDRFPLEIGDDIKARMVSSIVRSNKDIMSNPNLTAKITALEKQTVQIYKNVDRANKHFWPAMLDPGRLLESRPGMYTFGSKEEMQLQLQYSYASWEETPGAFEELRELKGRVGRGTV